MQITTPRLRWHIAPSRSQSTGIGLTSFINATSSTLFGAYAVSQIDLAGNDGTEEGLVEALASALDVPLVSSFLGDSALLSLLFVLGITGALGYTGLQLLKDLIRGLVLVFERPFQLGSRVTVGENRGEVVKIGLRTFHLKQEDGALVVIPNGSVLRRSMVSIPPDTAEKQVVFRITLPVGQSSALLLGHLREAILASPYCFAARPVELSVEQVENGGTMMVCQAYVFDGRFAQAFVNDVRRLFEKTALI